jgi:inosose dehydratase
VNRLRHRIAGAPITWGVCEVPGWGHQLYAERVLTEMSAIGLRATELGPRGFLPARSDELRDLLGAHGLELVGGFLPLVLHGGRDLEAGLAHAEAYAELLAEAGGDILVLAATTTQSGYDGRAELDADGWTTLVRSIDRVIELAGERGLTVAVHPHHGTVIERTHHIERLLEGSRVSLCVDTGHLLIGGTDPLDLIRSAPDRVAHVHLKDVAAGWSERVRSGRVSYADAVRGGMYRPLGTGDLDIAAIVRTLQGTGYRGWFVLEQDTILEAAPQEGAGPVESATASLDFFQGVASVLGEEVPAAVAGNTRAAHGAASRRKEEG